MDSDAGLVMQHRSDLVLLRLFHTEICTMFGGKGLKSRIELSHKKGEFRGEE